MRKRLLAIILSATLLLGGIMAPVAAQEMFDGRFSAFAAQMEEEHNATLHAVEVLVNRPNFAIVRITVELDNGRLVSRSFFIRK